MCSAHLLHVQVGSSHPLPAVVFNSEVIVGHVIEVTGCKPLHIHSRLPSEVILGFSSKENKKHLRTSLEHSDSWLGQTVMSKCMEMAPIQLEALNHTLFLEYQPEDEHLGRGKEEEHAPPPARNKGDKLESMLDYLHAIAMQPRNGRPRFPSFSGKQSLGKDRSAFLNGLLRFGIHNITMLKLW